MVLEPILNIPVRSCGRDREGTVGDEARRRPRRFSHHDRDQEVDAGSTPSDEINPAAIIQAMAEIGLDISKDFPKPLTKDVVEAADVVVTMGCGRAHAPYFRGSATWIGTFPIPPAVARPGPADPQRDRRARMPMPTLRVALVPHSSRERPGDVKKTTRTAGASNPQVRSQMRVSSLVAKSAREHSQGGVTGSNPVGTTNEETQVKRLSRRSIELR
jgi:hypothetical protein